MFKVNRETYRSRLKRGWCKERALNVVPIPTHAKEGVRLSTEQFTFIKMLVRDGNNGYEPMFTAWCCCGNPMHVRERDLFCDLNCGCCNGTHTPAFIARYNLVENDEEYVKATKERHKPMSFADWCQSPAKLVAENI